MGHLAKPAFAVEFGENSAIDVKFRFLPTAVSPKELLIEKTCSRPISRSHAHQIESPFVRI